MTIYARPDELVFAENASPGEVIDFPDILRGWGLAFEQTEGKPPMEWMNAVMKRQDQAIRYLLQRGVPEWSATEDYPANAQTDRHGVTYRALVANKGADPAATAASWAQSSIMVLPTAPALQLARTIYVEDREQILRWKTLGGYTGYISPEVGCISFGTQPNPRPFEVDLIGQTLDKTDPKYAALYAWANAAGLFVSSGSWTAGTYFFAEMSGNLFKVPDLRNMFIRFTGTDIDTANVRVLGSHQPDVFKSHLHTAAGQATVLGGQGGASAVTTWAVSGGNGSVSSVSLSGGAETRSINFALHPRMRL